ncbi:MAG: DUF4097 family beta strand repeat-containing protein [Ignavibacteriales bacterium]|nr:DUF4097 family beta strand repeat-containing protein [Ignavibacteriales bacterium]
MRRYNRQSRIRIHPVVISGLINFQEVMNASTSGGDIFLFLSVMLNIEWQRLQVETLSLNMKVKTKESDLSTSGGDIEVKLPKEFKASMELSTSGGDVSCSLNMSNVKKSSEAV